MIAIAMRSDAKLLQLQLQLQLQHQLQLYNVLLVVPFWRRCAFVPIFLSLAPGSCTKQAAAALFLSLSLTLLVLAIAICRF